jgi:lantibiotic biosynthesis protein
MNGSILATTADPPWTPLLAPSEASRVRAAVRAIVEARAAADPAGVASAIAGALLFGYHAEVIGDARSGELVQDRVDQVTALLPVVASSPWLHGGVVGAVWLFHHLDIDDGEADALDGFDATLTGMVATTPWHGHVDLISGLVGHGVYALERWPRPTAVALLERVIDRLHERASPRAGGIAWWTPPELLVPELRAHDPDGHVDLGVAHGVPGVLAILAAACAAGVNAGRARPLYDGAVRWLRRQLAAGADGLPCVVSAARGSPLCGPRTAWCYGEPGVAAATLAAARRTGDAELERAAIGLGLRAAARGVAAGRVTGAGVCHGTAGVAHVFNRMWQATGDPRFAAAARAWLDATLDRLAAGAGHDDTAPLLTGLDGVGLVLLAAISDVEPAWDRLLLLSLSPTD